MKPSNPAGGPSNRARPDVLPALGDQHVVLASSSEKIRLSILATALVDALGGPVEFHKRGTFPFTTSFQPNYNFQGNFGVIAAGTWTDDTSLTLCLARSIAQHGFDQGNQLDAYHNWYKNGELSATGVCFDIGSATLRALEIYSHDKARNHTKSSSKALKVTLQHIRDALSGPQNAGNGSLMRMLPVGLVYWRDSEKAGAYARMSSETTHPTSLAVEACQVWTGIIGMVMRNATTVSVVPDSRHGGSTRTGARRYSKFDLLRYISEYPYENEDLRKRLTLAVDAPAPPAKINDAELEAYYWRYHPVLQLISKTEGQEYRKRQQQQEGDDTRTPDLAGAHKRDDARTSTNTKADFPFALPAEKELPSSGYVLHTFVAALYCFFATNTFEAGAIMVVNLGNDADTVGAVYAGLAGCWYSSSDSDSDSGTGAVGVGGFDHHERSVGGASSQEGIEGGREAPSARHSLFWSEKVREWKAGLVKRDLVKEIAEELVRYEAKLGSSDEKTGKDCQIG